MWRVWLTSYLVIFGVGLLLYHTRNQRNAALTGAPAVRTPTTKAQPVTAGATAPPAPDAAPVTGFVPDIPLAEAVAAAPSAPIAEPVPLPAEAPAAPPLPQGWRESPSAQETPTVSLENHSATDPMTILFTSASSGAKFELPVAPLSRGEVRLPAGDYEYALLGPLYHALGSPDQTGVFRCRRFRGYQLKVRSSPYQGEENRRMDLGDGTNFGGH